MKQVTSLTSLLKSRRVIPYYFILPFFSIWVVFYLYPIIWAVWMSFNEFTFVGSTFVGFDHYVDILSRDSRFVGSLIITATITAIVVPTQVVIALVVAVIIESQLKTLKKAYRTAYLLPMVTSTTVMAVIFTLFLSSHGLVNELLQILGRSSISWLTDPFYAKISVGMTHGWRTTGLLIIVYIAGLQGIPNELYQAAKIDGANTLQQFRYITVPQLRPITILVLILATTEAFKLFDAPFVLTKGGPGDSTTTVIVLLYEAAFVRQELGAASAIAVVFTIILGSIMIGQYIIGTRGD